MKPRFLGLIGLTCLTVIAALWLMYRKDAFQPGQLEAQSAVPTCSPSPYAAIERIAEGGETRWSVSAEQNVDAKGVEIPVASSSGSALASTTVTLSDPVSKRSVGATFEVPFDRMLSRHVLPDTLTGEANDTWRRMMEHSAFDSVCSGPDPSLQRLLTQGAALRWWQGTSRMPDNYAVFVAATAAEPAHWLEYLGGNHRRLTAEVFSDELELIDEQGKWRLLRSGHGAVVHDTQRGAYAWIYVFPGGRKLRWPSVIGGSFEGNSAILQLDTPVMGAASQRIAIDLKNGSIRTLDVHPMQTMFSRCAQRPSRRTGADEDLVAIGIDGSGRIGLSNAGAG
jgi:hypothetical protein